MAQSNFGFLVGRYEKVREDFEASELELRNGYYRQSLRHLRTGIESVVKKVLPEYYIVRDGKEIKLQELLSILSHKNYIESDEEIQEFRQELNTVIHNGNIEISFSEAVDALELTHGFLASIKNHEGDPLLTGVKEFNKSYYTERVVAPVAETSSTVDNIINGATIGLAAGAVFLIGSALFGNKGDNDKGKS